MTLKNCPVPAEDEPVSREHEKQIYHYYGFPYYWAGNGLWGTGASPAAVAPLEPV